MKLSGPHQVVLQGLSGVVEALSETPLPEDPKDLLCVCIWGRLDDESGTLAADVMHNELVGNVVLEAEQEGNDITLSGEFNPHTHDSFKIPMGAGHNGGMTFQVQCRNAHPRAKGSCIMKRSFTRLQMNTFMSEVVEAGKDVMFEAHCPMVAYGKCTGMFRVDVTREKRDTYIKKIRVTLSRQDYDAWVRSIKN